MAPKLTVVSAVYGSVLDVSGTVGADVTDILSALVDNASQTITIPPSLDFNTLFGGDPAPFQPKQLTVRYTVAGVAMKPATFLEGALVLEPRTVPEAGAKPASDKLQILSATWGTADAKTDVKTQLEELVVEDKLTLARSMSLGKLLGDPAVGKAKKLEITYSGAFGKESTVVVPEKRRQDVVLSAVKA